MNGDTLWTRLYGEENVVETGVCLQPTFDGDFVMFGSKNENLYLFKIDISSEVKWEKEYESPVGDSLDWTYCTWMEQTSDSGFILLGMQIITTNPVEQEKCIRLIKADNYGNETWHKTFCWSDEYLELYNVLQTNDGGFIVSGNAFGGPDNFLLKLNEVGDSLWTKYYTTSHYGFHVLETNDDGFLLTGSTLIPAVNMYLIKTDELGEITWTKEISSELGRGRKSIEYSDGGFITLGEWLVLENPDTSKNYLVKISDQGDSLWSVEWNVEGVPTDLKETSDNGFIVLGNYSRFFNDDGIYLTKLTSEPNAIKNFSQNIPAEFSVMQNFPNPFNPVTTITYEIPERSIVTIKIYGVLGNEITTLVNEEKSAGRYEILFNAENLPSGIYFYRLQAGDYIETKKMVLMK
jgi:hypothetical protein